LVLRESEVVYWEEDGSDGSSYARGETQNAESAQDFASDGSSVYPFYVHASWMIIFVLITTQLATQFAQQHPQWTPVQHWAVGIATSLLFFASVLFP